MKESKRIHLIFVSRCLLGFLFIYHGLVPKILFLDATETLLVRASGIDEMAPLVSAVAGVGEILLGLAIIFLRSMFPVYIAGTLLLLLGYVIVVMPALLTAAFNPLTTNVLGLGLCFLITQTSSLDEA